MTSSHRTVNQPTDGSHSKFDLISQKGGAKVQSTKLVPRWFDGVTNMKVAQGWRKSIGLAGDSAINWSRWYHKVPDQPLAMVSMIKH